MLPWVLIYQSDPRWSGVIIGYFTTQQAAEGYANKRAHDLGRNPEERVRLRTNFQIAPKDSLEQCACGRTFTPILNWGEQ